MRKPSIPGALALVGVALCGLPGLPAHAGGPTTMTFNATETQVTFTGAGPNTFGTATPYDLTAQAGTNALGQYVADDTLSPGGYDYFAFTTNPKTGGDYRFTLQSTNPSAVNGLVLSVYTPGFPFPIGAGQVTQDANPASTDLFLTPNTAYYVAVNRSAGAGGAAPPLSYQMSITDVPEPGTWAAFALTGLFAAGLVLRARRAFL